MRPINLLGTHVVTSNLPFVVLQFSQIQGDLNKPFRNLTRRVLIAGISQRLDPDPKWWRELMRSK